MGNGRLVVVGGGFAGVWAALAAARELHERDAEHEAAVTLVSPSCMLGIRPRFYEETLDGVQVPLSAVLRPVGVRHRHAWVQAIDTDARVLTLAGVEPGPLGYDQLVLAPGSRLELPCAEEGARLHSVDSYQEAVALRAAIEPPGASDGALRAAVVGAGFTGVETAAELAGSLTRAARSAGRHPDDVEVTLIEAGPVIAPDFGPAARETIAAALGRLGVRMRTGATVRSIARDTVGLADGERIASELTVWSTGPTPSRLVGDVPGRRDSIGRLSVDSTLATGVDGVWAAGDVACSPTDGEHRSVMSCQHAMPQGKRAGANAAAVLAGGSPRPHAHHLYLTCLDLGDWGALLTRGWERDDILATGRQAKAFKRYINRSLIYPPATGLATELLRFGRPDPSSASGARARGRALKLGALRTAITWRAVDGPEAFAATGTSEADASVDAEVPSAAPPVGSG